MPSDQVKKYGSVAALVATGIVAGGVLAGTLSASATDTATSTPPASQGSGPGGSGPVNPNPGDPSRPQRSDEHLLTGDTASKVEAAVSAKYPNATFVRVETDSDGVYEAHITKADGTPAIVQVDKSFTVTGEARMGGPGGGHGMGDHDGDGPGSGSGSKG